MHENLSLSAKKILAAADREDWDTLTQMLAQLQREAVQRRYSAADKNELSETIQHLQAAIVHAQRRRDEIRDLVNKIGSAPL